MPVLDVTGLFGLGSKKVEIFKFLFEDHSTCSWRYCRGLNVSYYMFQVFFGREGQEVEVLIDLEKKIAGVGSWNQ